MFEIHLYILQDVKGQGKRVLNLEADLLETAKRASKKTKIGTPMTYKDQDEKVLRDKLVNRLKEKEVLKMEHFGERLKNAKENNYLDSSDDGVEDISDDDLEQVEFLTTIQSFYHRIIMSVSIYFLHFDLILPFSLTSSMETSSKERRTKILD